MTDLQPLYRHIDDAFDRHLERIRAFVRQPSISGVVICGASGGERPEIDIREVYQRHRQILGAPMGSVSDFAAVMHLLSRGEIEPVIDTVFPLSEIREAHRRFEAREHFGKIVLVP